MIRRETFRRRFGALLTALVISIALPVTFVSAQEVRFQGRVSWIAGETLILSTEDSPSVRVDLRQVDQDEYQRLTSGDLVMVTGAIADQSDRVVATSIELLEP